MPSISARHEVSTQLPQTPAIAALLRLLHGRILVVNRSPVAAYAREQQALVRGLVRTLRDGTPARPWYAADPGTFASWPGDSRAAHAAVLAEGWLARYAPPALRRPDGGAQVAVGLYEGPTTLAFADARGTGGGVAPDVLARAASRLPGRALNLLRVVATIDYRVVIVVAARDRAAAANIATLAGSALADRRMLGPSDRGAVWFSGSVLMPDPAVVAALDPEARRQWAGLTGRAGRRDAYWYPESWARFAAGGRGPECVAADLVGRSHRSGAGPPPGGAGTYSRATERGLCVPPGYALVDCVGTLGVNVLEL